MGVDKKTVEFQLVYSSQLDIPVPNPIFPKKG